MEVIYAPAKINIYLAVTGKAPNGYHLLDMLNVPISLNDVLTVSLNHNNSGFSLELKGDATGVGGDDISVPENNILFKLYTEFSRRFHRTFSLSVLLEKNIPIGAGLGGGSTDAAALLMYLASRVLGIHDNFHMEKDLLALAKDLGADVPFFLARKPCIACGIGEELTPIDLPQLSDYNLCLLAPPIKVSTKEVFSRLKFSDASPKERRALSLEWARIAPIQELLYNELFLPAVELAPEIGVLVGELRGRGILCSMTGSGSSIFIIHKKSEYFPESQIQKIASDFACRIFPCGFVNA